MLAHYRLVMSNDNVAHYQDMTSTALTLAPQTKLSDLLAQIVEIEPLALIPLEAKARSEELSELADGFEIIGNSSAETSATGVLKQIQAFIKEQDAVCEKDLAPFKLVVKKREAARDLLLAKFEGKTGEKERIKGLLAKFGEAEAKRREAARLATEAEAKRIREEAARLAREAQELKERQEREAREAIERVAREKREAEEKAERERQAALAEQERLRKATQEAIEQGTREEQRKAKEAEAAAAKKRQEEESARVKANKEAEEKAAAETLRLASESKAAQDTLKLQQAELVHAANEASKSVVTGPKTKGLSGQFDWKIEAEDTSSEERIRACFFEAFQAAPGFFDITLRTKAVKDALKANPDLKVPGLKFTNTYGVRTTR